VRYICHAALNLGVEHKGPPPSDQLRPSGPAAVSTPFGLLARVTCGRSTRLAHAKHPDLMPLEGGFH
jgi:hypothetical protein